MTAPTLFVGPLDRVLHLRALPALELFTAHQLSVLARHTEEVSWPAGTPVYRREEPVDVCYVIVDGRVAVRHPIVREVGPRDALGFVEQVARSPHGLDAVTQTETLALRLDWDSQLEICEQHFWVLWQYIRFFARQLAASNVQMPGRPPPVPLNVTRPLNFAERMLMLGTTGVFPSNSMDALAELARHVSETTVAPGDTLWTAGSPAPEFWLIGSGSVRIQGADDAGPVGPGRPAGLLEALAGLPRGSDARAVEGTRALRVGVEPFTDILEDHLEMAVDFLSSLARAGLQHGRFP